MFEVETCCRTCMKSDGSHAMNLFQPMQVEDGRSLEMDKIVMMCTGMKVSADDGLPQNICYDCVGVLQICDNFSKQVHNADRQFRNILSAEDTVKHEVFEIKPEHDVVNKFDDKLEVQTNSFLDFDNTDCKIESPLEDNHYKCEDCKTTFDEEEKLLEHVTRCQRKSTLTCYICSKLYRSKTSLDKHLAKHNEQHTCGVCSKIFPTAASLTQHMLNHNGKDEIKSEVDDKTNIDLHSFKCTECPSTFKKLRSLAMHKKKHKPDETKSYVCDICAKEFSVKPLLRRHLKIHSRDRPYPCTKCKKKYSRQDELEAHVRFKHELHKPFSCSTCSKSFAQRCNLVDHERTHTGETPYLCSECGKGFRNSSNLRQHLQRHSGLKPFACKLCPMTFATKGQMTTHELTHSGVHPYRCEQCGAAFTKPNSLKKHMLIHLGVRPFVCTTCNMRFTVKDHLTRHQRIHTGEKPYKCTYCERTFTQSNDLVKHTRGHVGQNVYQCKICSMRFRLLSELKQHYPSHYVNGDPIARDINLGMNQESFLVQKPQDPLEALQPPVNTKDFDQTITITFNSEGLSKDITINIRPEDLGQGF